MVRRTLLRDTALTLFGVGTAPAWLSRAAMAGTARKRVLVALFQRGAMDGLHTVIPYGEKRYAGLRPTLAVPRDRLLELDGTFAFHPALRPLLPLWEQKHLAAIHATGSPDP
ncbi:MAG TPA: hypothetical protein VFQ91_13915, partial [Bryobacteraceae bacterium]|nr:hypothetical protein [Bryobacteraceae bacterium]